MANGELTHFTGNQLEGWDPATVRKFADMVFLFPKVESDGGESLVLQLLNAQTTAELNKPWQERDEDEMLGRWMEVQRCAWEQSDFKDGMGVYLQIRAIDQDKVEPVLVTTSSVSVMAQLANVLMRDAFPVTCRLVKADKPTSAGYYPKHLQFQEG